MRAARELFAWVTERAGMVRLTRVKIHLVTCILLIVDCMLNSLVIRQTVCAHYYIRREELSNVRVIFFANRSRGRWNFERNRHFELKISNKVSLNDCLCYSWYSLHKFGHSLVTVDIWIVEVAAIIKFYSSSYSYTVEFFFFFYDDLWLFKLYATRFEFFFFFFLE